MLPCTLAGARPRLDYAIALVTLEDDFPTSFNSIEPYEIKVHFLHSAP
jgi:hypothetical protein